MIDPYALSDAIEEWLERYLPQGVRVDYVDHYQYPGRVAVGISKLCSWGWKGPVAVLVDLKGRGIPSVVCELNNRVVYIYRIKR